MKDLKQHVRQLRKAGATAHTLSSYTNLWRDLKVFAEHIDDWGNMQIMVTDCAQSLPHLWNQSPLCQ